MKTREYGVDLLKSVSMFMVVILHILGTGGVLTAAEHGSAAYAAAWLLETACICAVNCFGLVSGYVLSKGRYKRSRLLSLWLRVVLESLVITALFAALLRGSLGPDAWLMAVTPVIHGVYWYFTAYFALFFFIPYINKLLTALTKRETAGLALSVVLVFVFLGNITGLDLYQLHGGYGFLWLLCLYTLGGCLRNMAPERKAGKFWYLAAYGLSVLLAWAGTLLFNTQALISYTSPFTLLSAVLLLLFFSRLALRAPSLQKCIAMLARTSFGVYIIHTHPLIWTHILTGRFVPFLKLPVPLAIAAILLTACGIYAVCTLGDWLSEKFFQLIRTDLLENAADSLGKRRKPQNTVRK
ncbi:MAG: acyltransferase [Oscillospiraceae bacterium]|jgi:surface polysaccharide O-acyltransferase-like enzyme|nr:acyltransferase [Oscillospiraceae bacterium]